MCTETVVKDPLGGHLLEPMGDNTSMTSITVISCCAWNNDPFFDVNIFFFKLNVY